MSGSRRKKCHDWSDQQIKTALWVFYKKYGRIPAQSDFHPTQAENLGHWWRVERFHAHDFPHASTVTRHFGGWNKALKAAGLPVRQQGYTPAQQDLARERV